MLNEKQKTAVYYLKNDYTTEILFGGGAGGGKSFLGCLWIIEQCQNYKGTRWLVGRSKLKALKETTLNTFFDICSLYDLKGYNYNAQNSIIKFDNGSEIILKDLFHYPSDPNYDSLGSLEITGAFIDECNQITEKCWNVVKSRIRYKLDRYNLTPKILGTCNPAKNWVFTRFYKPTLDKSIDKKKKFIQALLSDNPNISKHYKENLLTLDKASKMRLLYGDWNYDSDPNTLIPFDTITNLFTNNFVNPGAKFMSCDIALQGSDKFVIIVWSGFIVEKIYSYDKIDAEQVVKEILNISKEYNVPRSNIVYDADGLGSFLRGYLKGATPFVNGSKAIKNENFKNLKTQCIYKFCIFANDNLIYIKDDKYKNVIIEELEQFKSLQSDNDATKLQVVNKATIKNLIGRSPDYSDALIMRMYYELKPKTKVKYNVY